MMTFLTLVLAVGLAVALAKLVGHRREVDSLHRAILRKQPFLREEVPGAAGREWEQLCAATNEMITEIGSLQRQRSGQLTQLEATLGSLQEAVLIVDATNYILLANKALQEIFPRAKDILGQRLELVLHSVAFLNYVESVRKGSAQPQHEIEFVDGGDTRWLEVTGTSIPSLNGQKGEWVIFVLHDITKLKRLEVVRKDFVANVSHELRTPLSVIKGYVETLVEGHEDMPLTDRDRFLKTISRHTDRLNSLLEDLLTLSRLESINAGLRRESCSLTELLAGIAEDYRSRTTASGHRLEHEVDPGIGRLLLDPFKLTQVFENLLNNALKYTPSGTLVRIDVKRRAQDILFTVADDGPGIPAADLPHLFERFYRVDKGRSRDKGGTGLGLSIVKHIVQLHGGKVWVESTVGQGTTFFLSLPARVPGVGA